MSVTRILESAMEVHYSMKDAATEREAQRIRRENNLDRDAAESLLDPSRFGFRAVLWSADYAVGRTVYRPDLAAVRAVIASGQKSWAMAKTLTVAEWSVAEMPKPAKTAERWNSRQVHVRFEGEDAWHPALYLGGALHPLWVRLSPSR